MDETIEREIAAMRTAYAALAPLNESGRSRAAQWLAAKLEVDLREYEPAIARECLDAAEVESAAKGSPC